jgi:hypothetical protein
MLLHICHLFFQLTYLVNLLHCNAMNFDSFSLGARHLFQNVVLFFVFIFSYMRLHMSYIVVFRIKISITITKKKYVSVFEKNILTVLP